MTPHEAIEQRDLVMKHLGGEATGVIVVSENARINNMTDDDIYEEGTALMKLCATLVPDAPIVIWSKAMWQAAISGCEKLAGVTVEKTSIEPVTKARAQLWLPDTEDQFLFMYHVDDKSDLGLTPEEYPLYCMAIIEYSHRMDSRFSATKVGFVSIMFSLSAKRIYFMDEPTFREGTILRGEDNLAMLFAAHEFMNQRIVMQRPETLHRNDRRRLEKAGKPIPDIRTVVLRRSYERGENDAQATGDGGGQPGNFSCQWIVTGGWQNRRVGPRKEPEKQSLRAVYVDSYVKGPADKPLKTPKATVLRVAR